MYSYDLLRQSLCKNRNTQQLNIMKYNQSDIYIHFKQLLYIITKCNVYLILKCKLKYFTEATSKD